MIGLAIFGWFVLLCLAGYISFATIAGVYICMGFSGNFPKESIIGFIISAMLLYAVWVTCPFEVAINTIK